MKKKVVLAGGSGFLGQHLAGFLLENGYEVVVLSRGTSTIKNSIKYVQWDAKSHGEWEEEIDGCNVVVNFTGKSVNCIYTKANRQEIVESRINSVMVLSEAVKNSQNPPEVFIQASSLAIYGDTRELCNEDAPYGEGFSADVCKRWETEFLREVFQNTRKVILRIGFILGKDGGALGSLKTLVKINLGGTVGSGKQYMSWLHVNDFNRMILKAMEDKNIEGIYNATSPTPVTNKEFMKTLRAVMGKGWAPPAPTPFVWLGAYLFMRTDPSLGLTSQRAVPKHFIDQGFEFHYTDINATLRELV